MRRMFLGLMAAGLALTAAAAVCIQKYKEVRELLIFDGDACTE